MADQPTNLLTEAEARLAWCPHVRVAIAYEREEFPDNVGFNRFIRDDGDPAYDGWSNEGPWVRCISGRCAMWRWKGQRWNLGQATPTGYCGLAGPPP